MKNNIPIFSLWRPSAKDLAGENRLCSELSVNISGEDTITGITLGTFDGLHLGHRVLFNTLQEELSLNPYRNTKSILISLYPQPRAVLNPKHTPHTLLTPLRLRRELVYTLPVDACLMIQFTKAFSQLSARDFVKKILVEPFLPKVVVVGFDWCFGRNREGGTQLLKTLGEEFGFKTCIVAPVVEPPTRGQSSTSNSNSKIGARGIRNLIEEGEVKAASILLGYPFTIMGRVVPGDGRGRLIGVPTANLHVVRQILPKAGVYKTRCLIRGEWYDSITNVGLRPTFTSSDLKVSPRVETHILDFSLDIYSDIVRLEFLDRVRNEMKFDSIAALKEQISKDINYVKGIAG